MRILLFVRKNSKRKDKMEILNHIKSELIFKVVKLVIVSGLFMENISIFERLR